VFANFVLADEINRAPAKVQSALLEVMAERQVSIGGKTYQVPSPFLVLATQNPVESEGVYPLPEAQRDRFLMKVTVGYPTPAEEGEIVRRMSVDAPHAAEVLTAEDLVRLQRASDEIFVHHAIIDYAVRLVFATRVPADHGLGDLGRFIELGASPRASLGLIAAARALALLRGRTYVLPEDVREVSGDILRHRLLLSYEALADQVPIDDLVGRIVAAIPPPVVAPRQSNGARPPRVPAPAPAVAPDPGAPPRIP
jgi:MoxR-like ATPase